MQNIILASFTLSKSCRNKILEQGVIRAIYKQVH